MSRCRKSEIVSNEISADAIQRRDRGDHNTLAVRGAEPPVLASAIKLNLLNSVLARERRHLSRLLGFWRTIVGAGQTEDLVPVFISSRTGGWQSEFTSGGDVLGFDLKAALGEK